MFAPSSVSRQRRPPPAGHLDCVEPEVARRGRDLSQRAERGRGQRATDRQAQLGLACHREAVAVAALADAAQVAGRAEPRQHRERDVAVRPLADAGEPEDPARSERDELAGLHEAAAEPAVIAERAG